MICLLLHGISALKLLAATPEACRNNSIPQNDMNKLPYWDAKAQEIWKPQTLVSAARFFRKKRPRVKIKVLKVSRRRKMTAGWRKHRLGVRRVRASLMPLQFCRSHGSNLVHKDQTNLSLKLRGAPPVLNGSMSHLTRTVSTRKVVALVINQFRYLWGPPCTNHKW